MLLLLAWLSLCVAVGMFASVRRNRNGFGWGVLAFFISPALAGVFVAILRERQGPVIVGYPHNVGGRDEPFPAFEDLSPAERLRLTQFRADIANR
jgi:hypothetical protein